MGRKLRAVRKLGRAAGLARGLYKGVGRKLKMPKKLSARPVTVPGQRGAIPPGVSRLPSGRLPPNARKWAGKIYKGEYWTADLARKYPAGVRFTRSGFADFSPHVLKKDGKTYKVVFKDGFQGRASDAAAANRRMGDRDLPKLPEGYTWHHHYDGKTLMGVPKDLHDAVKHAGGIALMGGE